MNLKQLPYLFAVAKLLPDAPLPGWATQVSPFFIARTSDELSVMCPQSVVPDAVAPSRNWVCFRVDGDLDFEQVGVVATVSSPLADNGISLFLVSTHDRDYVFVHQDNLSSALKIYRDTGFTIASENG